MSNLIKLAVDVMAGTHPPRTAIDGVAIYAAQNPNVEFLLCGDAHLIDACLEDNHNLKRRCTIDHCPSMISDDDSPIKAIRYGKSSSMYRVIEHVKAGAASACISSGNTAVLMVMAKMLLEMLPEIKRPALIGIIPNKSEYGGSVLVDMGANVECDEHNLMEFAIMGVSYAKVCLRQANPSIGILNVGVENHKGTVLQRKTHKLLSESNLNFKGYVEGFDIAEGTVDVIVTDGFNGNLVLKASEGTARLCLDYIKEVLQTNLATKIMGFLLKKHMKRVFSRIDPRRVGGAMFAGVNGIVVKSHGSSTPQVFANAMDLAYNLASHNVNNDIQDEIRILKEANTSCDSLMSKIKKSFGI